MIIILMSLIILILSTLCVSLMVIKLFRQPSVPLSLFQYATLSLSGFIAFVADVLGIGSFAINSILARLLGTFHEDELPAVNNGAQVLPGVIESLFFIQLVEVDLTTLLTLVIGTCVGGLLGGFIESLLSKQTIRLAMIGSFILIIVLLIAHQFLLLPINGDLTELHSWRLVIGFFAFMLCGALTSLGVGLFAMIQGILFLMNISPLLAFPIMTTAGAMQQPLTTLILVQKNKVPLKKTLILSLSGCIGVLITIPIFNYLTITWLHHLLFGVLLYHLLATIHGYWRESSMRQALVGSWTHKPIGPT